MRYGLTAKQALALIEDGEDLHVVIAGEAQMLSREAVSVAIAETAKEDQVGLLTVPDMRPHRRILRPAAKTEWRQTQGYGLALMHWPQSGQLTWVRTRA